MAYPLESLLRPAYELWAAASGFVAAGFVATAPERFLLSPGLALCVAGALCLRALWQARAGWKVLRYRAGLRCPRCYVAGADDIPWSELRLFLGRGFRWDQRHTQRLYEARLPEKQSWVGAGWMGCGLQERRDGDHGAGDVGGEPALHGVGAQEQEIWMNVADRVGHTLVLGTTRVGKTRLAEVLITQDIRRGDVVIVFDPKGDIQLLRRIYAESKRAGREGEFFVFHLGHPERSARYNPIGSISRITEVATRIAGQLPSEGESAAFREFVWRYVNVMARALVALGRTPDYEQINRHAADVEPLLIDYYEHWLDAVPDAQGWRDAVRTLTIDKKSLDRGLQSRGVRAVTLVEYARRRKLYDPIAHALASTLNYEKSYFDKLVASLLPLMEKLTSGRAASLLSPDLTDLSDWRPVFDWSSVINLRGIVYVGLDALSDYEVAAAVGNSMFADLTSVAGNIYKYGAGRGMPEAVSMPRIAIHADEFNELIGDEFVPLLNKAGGAGFQVTAYTQTWSDVEARMGSRAKAGQIAGNFNTLIMLRVKELETAELLTSQLPRVSIMSTLVSSSVSDTNDPTDFADFASRNEDRLTQSAAPLLDPSDLMQLPKGQAFALINGGQLYKLRMPLPDASDDPYMPGGLVDIGNAVRERYDGSWRRCPGEIGTGRNVHGL